MSLESGQRSIQLWHDEVARRIAQAATKISDMEARYETADPPNLDKQLAETKTLLALAESALLMLGMRTAQLIEEIRPPY